MPTARAGGRPETLHLHSQIADPRRTAPDRRRSGRVRRLPVQHAVPGRDAVSRGGRVAHRARRPPAWAAPRRSAALDGRTRFRRPVRHAVCLFWTAGLYAQWVRRDEALQSVAGHLDELPRRDVLDRLQTRVARSRTKISPRRTANSHLRLLALSNGTMFLLPDGWQPGGGSLFSVPQSSTTQLPGSFPDQPSVGLVRGRERPAKPRRYSRRR